MEKGADKVTLFCVSCQGKVTPCSNSSPLNFFFLKENKKDNLLCSGQQEQVSAFVPFSILDHPWHLRETGWSKVVMAGLGERPHYLPRFS